MNYTNITLMSDEECTECENCGEPVDQCDLVLDEEYQMLVCQRCHDEALEEYK